MFKWIKRIILLIIFVVALVLGVTFSSENSQLTTLILFGYALPELPLGLWIIITLFIGGFIGLLLSFLPLLWGKKTVNAKEKKIKLLEKELENLRGINLKS